MLSCLSQVVQTEALFGHNGTYRRVRTAVDMHRWATRVSRQLRVAGVALGVDRRCYR